MGLQLKLPLLSGIVGQSQVEYHIEGALDPLTEMEPTTVVVAVEVTTEDCELTIVALSVTVYVLCEERVYPIVAPIASARIAITATSAVSRTCKNLAKDGFIEVLFEPACTARCTGKSGTNASSHLSRMSDLRVISF